MNIVDSLLSTILARRQLLFDRVEVTSYDKQFVYMRMDYTDFLKQVFVSEFRSSIDKMTAAEKIAILRRMLAEDKEFVNRIITIHPIQV